MSIAPSATSARIMIVDDEPLNIKVVRKYLQIAGYDNFVTTTDATKAIDLIRAEQPDVILLDVMMPQVSGLEILQAVRGDEQLAHLPVLILTASTETKLKALELGASDFLTKPVDASDLVPRVRNSLVVKAHHDYLANYSQKLEREVRLRTLQLEQSQLQVVHSLARAAEYRDDVTGRHVMRVGRYVGIIARELGIADERATMIETAALLHDVGKIGIPDSILMKRGKLDPAEFKVMQKHCEFGHLIISPTREHESDAQRMSEQIGARTMSIVPPPLLAMAATIALTHHERWDGTGYPNRLAGENIPQEGRITSVADVFDALCSKRPYKPAFPLEQCLSIVRDGRGKQFDPDPVDALLRRLGDVLKVQTELADAA